MNHFMNHLLAIASLLPVTFCLIGPEETMCVGNGVESLLFLVFLP